MLRVFSLMIDFKLSTVILGLPDTLQNLELVLFYGLTKHLPSTIR